MAFSNCSSYFSSLDSSASEHYPVCCSNTWCLPQGLCICASLALEFFSQRPICLYSAFFKLSVSGGGLPRPTPNTAVLHALTPFPSSLLSSIAPMTAERRVHFCLLSIFPQPQQKPHEGRDFHQLWSLGYAQHLEQCLVLGRSLMTV